MRGTTALEARFIFEGATEWRVAGVGDYNFDTQADVLWQHPTGAVTVWVMNGISLARPVAVYAGVTDWKAIAR